MRIVGHTMGTPGHAVPEAAQLLARLDFQGFEAIRHDAPRRHPHRPAAPRPPCAAPALGLAGAIAYERHWYAGLPPPSEIA